MSYLIGSPFIFKRLDVNRPVFLNTPKYAEMHTNGFIGNIGNATKMNINHALKAAIGEHLERTALYMIKLNQRYIDGYNFIKEKECKIPVERVFLRSELFQVSHLEEDYYNDSSGVASHQSSLSVLNAAFLEYIERQSLVYNWLTATPGVEININSIDDNKIKWLMDSTYNFVDSIHVFNISIHESVYVILTIGYGKEYVGVGLSADWNLTLAISSSLNEFLQTFNNKINKSYIKDETDNYQKTKWKNHIVDDEENPHLLADIFMKHYGNKESLLNAYEYLFRSPAIPYNEINSKDDIKSSTELTKSIKTIGKDLGLDIVCCLIPSFVKVTNINIIKVLSSNGYPHILTERLDPYKHFIPNLKNDFLPNQYKPIPFP